MTEVPVVVDDLVAKHGLDRTARAIGELHGRAFTWPSELRKAAEEELNRRTSPVGSQPPRQVPDFDADPRADPAVVKAALAEARAVAR